MQEVCNMFGGVCVANSHLYLHQLTGNMVDVSAAALSVPRKCHPDIANKFFLLWKCDHCLFLPIGIF